MASIDITANDGVRLAALDGGEVGALIRARDWTGSLLGPIESWPQSLHSVLSACLNSPVLGAVLWGPELLFLYNDAYIPSLGKLHPDSWGKPVHEVWREAWDAVAPSFHQAMETGQGFTRSNVELVVERGRGPENTYWDFTAAPITGEDGRIVGLLNQGFETTDKVLAERHLAAEGERLRRMFEQAPGFICTLEGPEHVFTMTNAAYRQLIGHRNVVGKPVREALPDIDGQGFYELLDRVRATGEPFVGRSLPIELQPSPNAPSELRYLDFVYQPTTDAHGAISGIFVEGADVTDRSRAEA